METAILSDIVDDLLRDVAAELLVATRADGQNVVVREKFARTKTQRVGFDSLLLFTFREVQR